MLWVPLTVFVFYMQSFQTLNTYFESLQIVEDTILYRLKKSSYDNWYQNKSDGPKQ